MARVLLGLLPGFLLLLICGDDSLGPLRVVADVEYRMGQVMQTCVRVWARKQAHQALSDLARLVTLSLLGCMGG